MNTTKKRHKVDVSSLISNLSNKHLCVSGVWLGVNVRITTNKTCIKKRIGLHAQNLITILDAIINIILEGGEEGGGTNMIIWWLWESSLWQSAWYSYELQKWWGRWLQTQFGFTNQLACNDFENLHFDNCYLGYLYELQKWWGRWLRTQFGFTNQLACNDFENLHFDNW